MAQLLAAANSQWSVNPKEGAGEDRKATERGMVQLRVTAIPEVATHWSFGFSRLTDRPADASLANGTKSAIAEWH